MANAPENAEKLQGKRVALLGKLSGMSRREAAKTLRSQGAVVLDEPDATADLVVAGDGTVADHDDAALGAMLPPECRAALERGTLEIVPETQLWQRLGLIEQEPDIHRLYTPAMLAGLLGLEVAVIRRWHRRGLIVPVKEVRRLPYFDFQEVATARRLAELLAAGVSARTIEKRLAAISRLMPDVKRPLVELTVVVQGKEILLRRGDDLVEPAGQFRFDFDAPAEQDEEPTSTEPVAFAPGQTDAEAAAPKRRGAVKASLFESEMSIAIPSGPEQLCRLAGDLEEDGQLEAAAEMYRAAMAGGGPTADLCFQVAELLYRQGDAAGARERYYMAIELDEDFVEARANLGCVLAELGQLDLAVAAFEGALKYHADYADVHYHLAQTLDDLDRANQAEDHYRAFLALAPDSPWADEARQRLAAVPERLF